MVDASHYPMLRAAPTLGPSTQALHNVAARMKADRSRTMNQQHASTSSGGKLRALGGVLFAVWLLGGEAVAGLCASSALPMPGAPAAEVARYYTENRTAALVWSAFLALSALSLLAFVAPVTAFVRRVSGERSALPGLATV